MSGSKKKPEPKKQEPPEGHHGGPVEEPYRPMGVPPEPDPLDRLAALEAKVAVLEHVIDKHQRYHFGGLGKG